MKLPFKPDNTPYNFIIIDDSHTMTQILKKTIEEFGGQVLGVALNADDAIFLLNKYVLDVDYVTLDVEMPDINGLELIPELQVVIPDLKIIMISSKRSAATIQSAIQLGAKYFIAKPFVKLDVFRMLNSIIEADFTTTS